MAELTWHDWSPEIFDEAADSGKLILLDLMAFWCHWCHVMDDTTYKDEKVIELLNKNAVCVRVDIDQNPDITERYNLGGFPTTAFCTSGGELIGGGTYVAPENMVQAITQIVTHIEEKKTIPVTDGWTKRINLLEKKIQPATSLDPEIHKNFFNELKQNFDQTNGGVGNQMKFPVVDLVRLLWIVDTDESKKLANLTLKGMLKLQDPKGGFFRYSEKADWTQPHTEKMLDLNAQMIKLLKEAFDKTNNEEYKQAMDATIKYLATLKQKNAYGGAQDASEDYYAGKSTTQPPVDNVIYTDKNAQLVTALLLSQDTDAKQKALDTLKFLMDTMTEGNEVYHYYDDKPNKTGLLQDYAYLIQALLTAAEETKEGEFLKQADKLTKHLLKQYWNLEKGGFKDRIAKEDDIGYLKDSITPLEPNAIMAVNLHRLAILKQDKDYAQYAKKTLLRFGNQYKGYGVMATPYILAVYEILS